MDATYGSNEFWTNANRQEMMELGLASQHEGEDFYFAAAAGTRSRDPRRVFITCCICMV
jgi:hypothetical protein